MVVRHFVCHGGQPGLAYWWPLRLCGSRVWSIRRISGGRLYFLTAILAISGIVGLIAVSVGELIPPLANPIGRFAVILFVFLFLASINIRGVRIGARAVEAVTLIKLVPLIIFVIAGSFFHSTGSAGVAGLAGN